MTRLMHIMLVSLLLMMSSFLSSVQCILVPQFKLIGMFNSAVSPSVTVQFVIGSSQYISIGNSGNPGCTTDCKIETYIMDDSLQTFSSGSPNGVSARVSNLDVFQNGAFWYMMATFYENSAGLNDVTSTLFKWNGIRWNTDINLQTSGAMGSTFMTVGGGYLIIANKYSSGSSTYDVQSGAFQYTTAFPTTATTTITTYGCSDVRSFIISGTTYFVVANNRNQAGSYTINSEVFRWTGAAFTSHQTIATIGAVRWAITTFGGTTYAFVSNYQNGANYNQNSVVYSWSAAANSGNGGFVSLQSIATQGAMYGKFFVVQNLLYLAIAQYRDAGGAVNPTTSPVYRFNGATFVLFQSLNTYGCRGIEFFMRGSVNYLITLESGDGTTAYRPRLYRFIGFSVSKSLSDSVSADITITLSRTPELKSVSFSLTREKRSASMTRSMDHSLTVSETWRISQSSTDSHSHSVTWEFTPEVTTSRSLSVELTLTTSRTITKTVSEDETVSGMTRSHSHSQSDTHSNTMEMLSIDPTTTATLTDDRTLTMTKTISASDSVSLTESPSIESTSDRTPSQTKKKGSRTKTKSRERSESESLDPLSFTTTMSFTRTDERTKTFKRTPTTFSKSVSKEFPSFSKSQSLTLTANKTRSPTKSHTSTKVPTDTPELPSYEISNTVTETQTLSTTNNGLETEVYTNTQTETATNEISVTSTVTVMEPTVSKTRTKSKAKTKTIRPPRKKTRTYTKIIPTRYVRGSVLSISGEQLADYGYVPRNTIELTLEADLWTDNIKEVLNQCIRSTTPELSGGFESCKSDIISTSLVSVSDDRKILTITFGYSSKYTTTEPEVLSFVNMNLAMKNLKSHSPLFEPRELQNITVSPQKAKDVVQDIALSAAAYSASVMSMASLESATPVQTMALVGQMSCADSKLRKTARSASWTLAPLFPIGGDISDMPVPSSMVVWNIILLLIVVVCQLIVIQILRAHRGWSFGIASEKTHFPHVSLSVYLFLLPALTSSCVSSFCGNGSVGEYTIGFFGLVIVVSVLGRYGYWTFYERDSVSWHNYLDGTSWFAVRGVWRPEKLVNRQGALFSACFGKYPWWSFCEACFMLVIGAVSGIRLKDLSLCDMQVYTVASLFFLLCLALVFLMPYRNRVDSIIVGVTYALQGGATIMLKDSDVAITLSVVASMLAFVRAVYSCVASLYERRSLAKLVGTDDDFDREKALERALTKEARPQTDSGVTGADFRADGHGAPLVALADLQRGFLLDPTVPILSVDSPTLSIPNLVNPLHHSSLKHMPTEHVRYAQQESGENGGIHPRPLPPLQSLSPARPDYFNVPPARPDNYNGSPPHMAGPRGGFGLQQPHFLTSKPKPKPVEDSDLEELRSVL